jgi:hypothetical protein
MSITPQIEAHVAGVPFGRDDESGWRLTLFGLFQGSKRAKATGSFAVNEIKVAVVSVGKQIRDLAVSNPYCPKTQPGSAQAASR